MKRFFVFLALLAPSYIYPATAAITVNYNTEINAFTPSKLLGNNSGVWLAPAGYNTNAAKIKAAGSSFIRFPGGSLSNEYHWNGAGWFDAQKIWHSNPSAYSKGFIVEPEHRGSSSIGYGKPAKLTDGLITASSQWQSDTITAASATTNAYVIIRLGAPQYIDQVKIYWGDTYAAEYAIQYWSSTDFAWAPHQGNTNYWQTLVTVTGNTGGTDIRTIPATFGQNFRILMKKSSGTGYKMNEAELYSGGYKKTTNTATTAQTETYASPTDKANAPMGWTPDYDFLAFVSFLSSIGPDAQGICSVNFGTGTYEEAAAWVRYAKDNGYLSRIKYWEVGNETEGVWEAGGPVDAEYYTERFILFSDAMKAVDPDIKICGPVLASLQNNSELYDGMSFMDKFLQVLQSHGKLASVDALAFHMYPDWQNTVEATSLSTPNNWAAGSNYKAFIDNLLVKYYGDAAAKELIMSEYNCGAATKLTMDFMNSLWTANWLGEYAKSFGNRAFANQWDIMNNNASTGNYDNGFLEIGQQTGAYKYQPRSSYWGMYMINNYLACADEFGNTLVAASSNQGLLPVYAAKRNDGKLSLMVINKSKTNAYTSSINISGYAPDPAAELYTFAANASAPYYVQNYVWHDDAAKSYADPDLAPVKNTYAGASGSFSFDFPAYSISVFNFVPFGSTPTFTPSISPTQSQTNTSSATPTFTITKTVTVTKTITNTRTVTDTHTITKTRTVTPTYTFTPSITLTFTATATKTPGEPIPGGAAQQTYKKTYVYPSPFDSSKGHTGIWFLNLTKHSIIKIYDMSGKMVYSREADTPQGAYFLRFEAQRRRDVFAPGVYVYVVNNRGNQTATGKFAVIR